MSSDVLTAVLVPIGGSLTAPTERSNVSVAVRPLVAVTVTVMVVVPVWLAAGVICSVREPPEPVKLRLAGAFGTSVVFEDDAVLVHERDLDEWRRMKRAKHDFRAGNRRLQVLDAPQHTPSGTWRGRPTGRSAMPFIITGTAEEEHFA